jgi:hypothetical protein
MAALDIGLRTILAAVFAVAFVSKVRSRAMFTEFAGTLADFGWLRGRRRSAVALAVPAAEAVLVVLLAIPVTVMAGFAMAVVMLAVFTGVTGREVAAGRLVRCRCFGGGSARIGSAQLARNLLLLGCAGAGVALAATSTGGASAWMLVLAIGGALLAATFIVHWDELATLARAA